MFGLGTGKAAYPELYSVTAVSAPKKSSKKDASPASSSPASLEPALVEPPSPERIRAYTEQMKRSSLFGNSSRSNTLSSATSSFRSRESTSASTDNVSLSRKSSGRSHASSMPSIRSDRPESVQIFGSIFSRNGRKLKKGNNASSLRSLGSSTTLDDSALEEESAKDHYYGRRNGSLRRQYISEPYNFQHVTHTRQDHLPNLHRTSRMKLVSEFSAIRASQAPSNGELKGIRAQDLHFENFSSEALTLIPTEELSIKLPKQRAVLRKPGSQSHRPMPYAKSVDNLRVAPPRPPRSPLSATCPMALPARTSSQTASVLYETFDPLASTTIERPYTNGGVRRPTPFLLPIPPPPSWDEEKEDFSNQPLSYTVTTPGDEAWPLTSPSGTFGIDLTDVKEEDEDVLSKRSRFSTASAELRMSQSVPALRRKSEEQANENEETGLPTQDQQLDDVTSSSQQLQPSPTFQLTTDSWEEDIDYCYDHEIEATCDYQWDQCSANEVATETETVAPAPSQPALQLHLQNEERGYHGRFRPSLLVASAFDVPELSPLSAASTQSDPRTPSNLVRPAHVRAPSHASSFKESHGFTLSPSLLIPADFQSQMDQDVLYNEQFGIDSVSGTMFSPGPFTHSTSPIDEGASSAASFHSSDFSRGSARSSSSTRISANSRVSQDSIVLLARAARLSQEHRSIGSASSLPDLIPSSGQGEADLSNSVAALEISNKGEDIVGLALASLEHRRNKSLGMELGRRRGDGQFASPPAMLKIEKKEAVDASSTLLSPVAELPTFPNQEVVRPLVHGRKTSVPVSSSAKEFKGRARAKSSATRGSYMLFPQV